jgi:phytol kinase
LRSAHEDQPRQAPLSPDLDFGNRGPCGGSSSDRGVSSPETSARLTATELRRQLWHMAPGLLPFLLWPFPHSDPLSFRMRVIILTLGIAISGTIFLQYRRIQRTADRERLAAVAGYALPVLATLFLLPGAAEIGMTVLAILAFGDGLATLGGLLLGGPALPWNNQKSWSGLASFVFAGTLAGAAIYWGESNNLRAANPGASWESSFLIAGGSCLVAAIAESLPSRINDNLRVGIAAGVATSLFHGLIVGWSSGGV